MNIPIDISNIVIRTERLLLRPFQLSDLDDFYEYASVDGVGQMAGWMPHESKEKSLLILKNFINEKKTFAIVLNDKVIGSIGIETYNENVLSEFEHKKGREVGYVLSKKYWGQGYMPEAVKAVNNYLFRKLKCDFIICGHYIDNDQSRRVQEKCGFRHYKKHIFTTNLEEKEKEGWYSVIFIDDINNIK